MNIWWMLLGSTAGAWLASINVRAMAGCKMRRWTEVAAAATFAFVIFRIFWGPP